MSRRETVIKATAAALQPKSLDLTQYRQRSARDSAMRVRADDAAGALAFAALDREDGFGDALRPILLRLKSAQQRSRPLFIRALMLLIERHGYDPRRPSETLYGLGFVALFEWLNDACPKCRSSKPRAPRVTPCPACRPTPKSGKGNDLVGRRRAVELEVDGQRVERLAAGHSPDPGCLKCKGLGRIFADDRARGGMRCVTCNNTGRQSFGLKQRWKLLSEFLGDMQVARRESRRGIDYALFRERWHPAYIRLLDYLRRADRTLVSGLDLHAEPGENRSTEPERFDPIEENAEDEPLTPANGPQ